ANLKLAQRSQLASREAALRCGYSSEHTCAFCASAQYRPAKASFARREVACCVACSCIFFCAQFSRERRQREGNAPTRGDKVAGIARTGKGSEHRGKPRPSPC
ncbi:unnamed protein product, partial [Laminaria digitata]